MKATDKREIKLPPFKVKHVVSTLSQVHGWGITQLNIPETWKITRGEDITVMVIDTGYTNHSDLKGALIQDRCKSFISSEKDIDDHNGHSCVSPDTLIHTSYNGIETIEQLYNSLPLPEKIDIDENGEEYAVKDVSHLNIYTYSLDNNGKTNINKILLLHKAVVNEECIKIKLEGNIEYLLTPWHQVPVVSSNSVTKKRADTISTDDSFIFPSSDIGGSLCSTYLDVPVANYIECPNCSYRIKNIKQRKQKKYRCWKCGVYNKDWNIGTEHLPLNEELAYISGLIITDGNINLCNGYVISFTTTTKELIDRFSDIAEKYGFGRGTIVSTTPCYDLRFSCKRFVNFLLNLGILAKRKSYIQQLPQLISKSPKSVICAFLAGVIDGDGCISECNTRNRITSVSLVWIKQLCALFNSLGMSAYYNINKNMLFNDRKTQSTIVPYVYNVCFSFPIMDICKYITHPKKLLRCQKQPKHSIRKWRNIKQIEKIPYYGHFYDFTIENDHTYIANGHFVSNTHCIGVIAARDNDIGMVGVAPKCNVISVKVLGADGSGDYESIRNALRYAIKIQPHVISMSLGAYEYDSELHKLVKKLYSMNIPIIAAAGNDGTDNAVNYPGKFPETICVTAFDKNGNPADFNSTGKEADFSAPGVDIYSTWLKNKYASLSGTCTIGDTIIYTNKGPKKIKDIKVGDIVYSLNESILDIQQNKVINNICNGVKQTYKLQTDHNTIYATANHPFLVYDKVIKSKGIRNRYFRELKWKELKDLAKNDLICVPKIIKSNSNIEKIDKLFLEVNDKIIKNRRNNLKIGKPLTITPAFCQFIGAYLGDGYLLHNKYRSAGIGLCVRCGYKQLNKKMPDYYNNIFEKITGLQMSRTANGDLYVYSSYIADFFENIGLGGDCHGKRLPEWVYELPPEYKEALISGIIDSDGWISKRGDFGLQLCNNELLTDIKCLLDMMGVKCSNIKQRKSVGHTFDKSNKKEYTSYYLTSTKIKNINLNLQDATYNQRLNKKNIFEKHNYDYCSNDEKYLKDQNIKLEKIRNINMDDFKEVYDLTVENNHNYIAEGIIIHNSMATPFMAGVVALLLSKHLKQELQTGKNDCKTVDQIKEHLKKYCDDKGISGHDNIWGYGVVDPIKLIKEDMTVNDTKQTGQQIQSLWQKICKLVRGLFNRI